VLGDVTGSFLGGFGVGCLGDGGIEGDERVDEQHTDELLKGGGAS
jgi:hypothetical protein